MSHQVLNTSPSTTTHTVSLVSHVVDLNVLIPHTYALSSQCMQVLLQRLLLSPVLQCVILSFEACYTDYKKTKNKNKAIQSNAPLGGLRQSCLKYLSLQFKFCGSVCSGSVQSALLCLIKEMLSLKSSPIAVCFWFVDTPDFSTSLFAR